jgi:replicative DNA helicase
MKRNTTKLQADVEKPFGFETLPNATIAEESLLSACFQSIEDTLTATDFISEDDFYLEKHRRIFAAMKKVATSHNARKTGRLDYAELISAMTGTNIDNPALYLAGLVADVPLAVNIEHTAGIIKQKSILRQTIGIAYAGVRECMSCNGDTPSVIDRLQQNILSVGSLETSGNDAVHVGSLFESAIDRYEAASLTTGITGVTSGYPDIDHITSGFQPGDMVILAARPGMGKTALALNIAQNAAESGTPVSFFSLEMGKNQLMTRLIAGETGINSRRLESGRLSPGDWDTLSGINQSISSLPLYIDDTADLHFSGFRRKLRIAYKKQGIRFAVILSDAADAFGFDDTDGKSPEAHHVFWPLTGSYPAAVFVVVPVDDVVTAIFDAPMETVGTQKTLCIGLFRCSAGRYHMRLLESAYRFSCLLCLVQ